MRYNEIKIKVTNAGILGNHCAFRNKKYVCAVQNTAVEILLPHLLK